jgi:hypothetical protein
LRSRPASRRPTTYLADYQHPWRWSVDIGDSWDFGVLADGLELDDELVSSLRMRRREQRHLPEESVRCAVHPAHAYRQDLEVSVKRILAGSRAGDVLTPDAVNDPSH